MMVIMSVDLGKARTGLALCDKTEFLASPYKVIFEKSPKKLPEQVAQAAKEANAEMIVVGLPKNMDGTQVIGELTGLPVALQDERGTTITAHTFLNDTNTRGKKRKNVVDEVAATIILQNYLDKKASANAAKR